MARNNRRNAQGSGSIRKRPDGTWEGRYTVGRDPGTGKQVQKSVYGKTQAEVRKKVQKMSADIDDGTYIEPSKLTVGLWLDIWLEEYTGNLKPYSLQSYKAQVKNHIKPALGAVKLSALTAPMIQKLLNNVKSSKPGNLDLSPKSIKNIHGVLHKALAQAVELGYLKFNAADACKLPKIMKPQINPLTEDEISNFLRKIEHHRYGLLYFVSLFTGMRQGEILGLTWDCVRFDEGTIHLYRQLQRYDGKYQFQSLKNNKTRKITPAQSVMDALKRQKLNQHKWQLLTGEEWNNKLNLVFTNEYGRYLVRSTIYKSFRSLSKKLREGGARFHDLRHTYAVTALQAGDDVKTVQENLGHHTAAFTLDQYGHFTEHMEKASSERMERFIKGL